jgi:hypothetical protein
MSDASYTWRISVSPSPVNLMSCLASSIASSFDAARIRLMPAMTSFASVKGPSVTAISPSQSRTRALRGRLEPCAHHQYASLGHLLAVLPELRHALQAERNVFISVESIYHQKLHGRFTFFGRFLTFFARS